MGIDLALAKEFAASDSEADEDAEAEAEAGAGAGSDAGAEKAQPKFEWNAFVESRVFKEESWCPGSDFDSLHVRVTHPLEHNDATDVSEDRIQITCRRGAAGQVHELAATGLPPTRLAHGILESISP